MERSATTDDCRGILTDHRSVQKSIKDKSPFFVDPMNKPSINIEDRSPNSNIEGLIMQPSIFERETTKTGKHEASTEANVTVNGTLLLNQSPAP